MMMSLKNLILRGSIRGCLFRSLIVHEYEDIDPQIPYNIITTRLRQRMRPPAGGRIHTVPLRI
jgi:hypothetical protein